MSSRLPELAHNKILLMILILYSFLLKLIQENTLAHVSIFIEFDSNSWLLNKAVIAQVVIREW